MSSKKEIKKTRLSKVAVAIVILYSLCGIVALIAQDVGISMMKNGNTEGFQFWYNKVWSRLSSFVILILILGAIPNVILNIVGMIKEKRVLLFLFCIIEPIVIWLFVVAVAIAYF